jgi:uncharacterized protein YneF (UPF0154 family)
MKHVDEIRGFRKLLIVAIIFMLLFFAAIGICSIVFQIYERMTQPPRVASEQIKARMKYHGASVAECDWNGVCYFYDKRGRRAKL